MLQRTITAVLLIVGVVILIQIGNLAVALGVLLCVGLAVYEEYNALKKAGYRVITWPTWGAMLVSAPLMYLLGGKVLIPVTVCATMLTMANVIFREYPRLQDILASIVPLLFVVLSGMCMEAVAFIQPVAVQRVLMYLMIGIPAICDTAALFSGTLIGGPKLCPQVSPKKTIAGAIGGMVGAMVASAAIGAVAYALCGPETRMLLPHWWTYLVLGFFGGLASQLGDLFASLVKRHCGIKDFSNLFPGHGGMLDRLDSIFFMAVIVSCVRMMGTGI